MSIQKFNKNTIPEILICIGIIICIWYYYTNEIKKNNDLVWQEISYSIEQDLKERYGNDITIRRVGNKLLFNFNYGKQRDIYEITIKNFQMLYD